MIYCSESNCLDYSCITKPKLITEVSGWTRTVVISVLYSPLSWVTPQANSCFWALLMAKNFDRHLLAESVSRSAFRSLSSVHSSAKFCLLSSSRRAISQK